MVETYLYFSVAYLILWVILFVTTAAVLLKLQHLEKQLPGDESK